MQIIHFYSLCIVFHCDNQPRKKPLIRNEMSIRNHIHKLASNEMRNKIDVHYG